MKRLVLLSFIFLITACSEDPKLLEEITLQGKTMGTTFTVRIVDLKSDQSSEKIEKAISDILNDVNGKMSLWEANSEIIGFNQNQSNDWITVSADLYKVAKAADVISRLSDGFFDVTLEPLIKLWGFSNKGMVIDPPDDDAISSALASVGYKKILYQSEPMALKKDDPDLTINLSAIAKGFGIDQIANYLENLNAENYMVEIGGDLKAKGTNPTGQPWRIAIEKPEYFTRTVHRIINLDGAGMATSGDYRNYFEKDGQRYSHIINPNTGKPITHKLASVTVLSDNAMMADGFATALLSMGDEQGLKMAEENGIAAFFIIRDGETFIEKKTSSFNQFVNSSKPTD